MRAAEFESHGVKPEYNQVFRRNKQIVEASSESIECALSAAASTRDANKFEQKQTIANAEFCVLVACANLAQFEID